MLTIERPSKGGDAIRSAVRMPYVASLDGVRAVSVAAVLLYHGNLYWLKGGFLGVEVFFVISGYLITSLLLGEHRATGMLNLGRFWLGRARRLLPALYLMLFAVATWWLLFYPGVVGKLKGQFLAGIFYFTNWFLIFTRLSYFDHLSQPSPLIHLWSLAVEEQFYLVWPLVLLALLKVFKDRPLGLLASICAAAMVSSVVMAVAYRSGHDPSGIYYGTGTRAGGLLIGAALAVVWRPWLARRRPNRRRGNLADAAGVMALVLLVLFFRFSTEEGAFLYRGGFLLVDLTTALLIAACVSKSIRLLPTSLGSKPLVWVGQRSYGIYLWHWPIFVILRAGLLGTVPLFLLRVGLTGVIAAASYRYVETPFRSGAVRRRLSEWRSADRDRRQAVPVRVVAGGCALSLLAVVVVTSVAGRTAAQSPLQKQLEQAARDPANRAEASSVGIRSSPPTGPAFTPSATTTAPPSTATPGTSPVPGSGPVATSVPPATALPPPPPGPFAIGDSVMLGAANALRAAIPGIRVDAEVGRQWLAGVDLVKTLAASGQLGSTVIIGLGNNGTVTPAGFNAMMAAVAGVPHVVVVDVRVDRSWQNADNAVLRAGAAGYPNIHLLDWYGFSAGHGAWFFSDGTHLRPQAAPSYAAFIAAAVTQAGS
jgi:peptidoglycan/LPS O-acetylase OafA/YrhL